MGKYCPTLFKFPPPLFEVFPMSHPMVTCHTFCRYSAVQEQPPPHRPQRNSVSGHGGGPISGDYYYRGQEAGARSSQEYYSQVRIIQRPPPNTRNLV